MASHTSSVKDGERFIAFMCHVVALSTELSSVLVSELAPALVSLALKVIKRRIVKSVKSADKPAMLLMLAPVKAHLVDAYIASSIPFKKAVKSFRRRLVDAHN